MRSRCQVPNHVGGRWPCLTWEDLLKYKWPALWLFGRGPAWLNGIWGHRYDPRLQQTKSCKKSLPLPDVRIIWLGQSGVPFPYACCRGIPVLQFYDLHHADWNTVKRDVKPQHKQTNEQVPHLSWFVIKRNHLCWLATWLARGCSMLEIPYKHINDQDISQYHLDWKKLFNSSPPNLKVSFGTTFTSF